MGGQINSKWERKEAGSQLFAQLNSQAYNKSQYGEKVSTAFVRTELPQISIALIKYAVI